MDGETSGGGLTPVSVRYKFWSCCCIKTLDFNSFLDQKGCSSGRHCWVTKKVQHLSHWGGGGRNSCWKVVFVQDKKKVACRHDWHQTGNSVVLTIYAKNANADLCCVEANRTVVSVSGPRVAGQRVTVSPGVSPPALLPNPV